MNKIKVCYGCKDRTIGCHGKCNAYRRELVALKKYNEKVFIQKEKETNYYMYKNEAKRRMGVTR